MSGNFSPYDFITVFVPGAVFAAIVSFGSNLEITSDDAILAAALYFFYGVVASRFGSIIVQPALEFVGFLKVGDYDRFIEAEKKDEKIQTLLESRNFYRSLFTVLLFSVPIIIFDPAQNAGIQLTPLLLLILSSSAIMLFSLRKQSAYIEKRVQFNTKDS